MEKKILLLFAHPLLEKSRVNKVLMRNIRSHPSVTFHDLYEEYPEFNIDINREKKLLLEHSLIIWHHPFYWYSCPPLLKQWIDMVLEVGWAYGPGGTALEGKKVIQVISTGGPQAAYTPEGHNHYTIRQFLAPFERTALLCRMEYLPPFVIHGTHRLTEEQIREYAAMYNSLLDFLSEVNSESIPNNAYINEYIEAYINNKNSDQLSPPGFTAT